MPRTLFKYPKGFFDINAVFNARLNELTGNWLVDVGVDYIATRHVLTPEEYNQLLLLLQPLDESLTGD